MIDDLYTNLMAEPATESLIAGRIAWEAMIRAKWADQWLVNIPDAQGVTRTLFGIPVRIDHKLPATTIELRAADGRLLGKIENIV